MNKTVQAQERKFSVFNSPRLCSAALSAKMLSTGREGRGGRRSTDKTPRQDGRRRRGCVRMLLHSWETQWRDSAGAPRRENKARRKVNESCSLVSDSL